MNALNVLYYGNCQPFALKTILNLKEVNEVYIACYTTDLCELEFTDIIIKQDIIILQPINDNYRDKHYLSTNYIINNCKKNCQIIMFDSCHFDFYYFDLTYKMFNDVILHNPSDYHYNKMVECYHNNLPVDYYIENFVNNIDLKTVEELEEIANKSLNVLIERHYNNVEKYKKNDLVQIISTHDFIKNNYKEKLLFYSMNHPTKYLFHFIAEEIVKILNINNTICYDVNVLDNPKSIIYKCVQNAVHFDINECEMLVCGKTNLKEITQLYYDAYKDIGY